MHLATYFGHSDVVKALLEAGANVDEVNDTGDTALHKASFIGNEVRFISPGLPDILYQFVPPNLHVMLQEYDLQHRVQYILYTTSPIKNCQNIVNICKR